MRTAHFTTRLSSHGPPPPHAGGSLFFFASSRLRASRPHGFTLLEMVFALGLSVVLMAAVLSAIDLYRQVETSGREQVEQAQIARAVFRMLEIDLRSARYVPPEEAEAESDDSAEEDDEAAEEEDPLATEGAAPGSTLDATATPESTLDTEAALSSGDVGIYGDMLQMVIHADRPARPLETVLMDPLWGGTIGDRRAIAWFVADARNPGLAGAAAGAVAATHSGLPAESGEIQGVARLEGSPPAIQYADQIGDVEALLSRTRLIAPEVNLLRFRYFDGLMWYEAWDTAAFGTLPNAVEITLGFRHADPAVDETVPDRLYRHVVTLPSSQPPVITTESQEVIP